VSADQLQLETLRTLRLLQKGRGGQDSDDGEGGALDHEGQAKKLKGIRRLRRQWERRPHTMTEDYVRMVRERLGIVDDRMPWHLRHYSIQLRSAFGRFAALYRIHYWLSEVLHLVIFQGELPKAMAMIVQLLKATHQAALNGGSWEIASLLIPGEDPLLPPRFAGQFGELAAAAAYREGLAALRVGTWQPTQTGALGTSLRGRPARVAGRPKRRPRTGPRRPTPTRSAGLAATRRTRPWNVEAMGAATAQVRGRQASRSGRSSGRWLAPPKGAA